jgi:transposase-like protein
MRSGKRHEMLCQQMPDDQIKQTADCPKCKTPSMTIARIVPGVFLGGAFVRYRCQRCRKEVQINFPPPMD